jgi:hypothetical protein
MLFCGNIKVSKFKKVPKITMKELNLKNVKIVKKKLCLNSKLEALTKK